MAVTKKQKISSDGKNIRTPNQYFNIIKEYTVEKGLHMGQFVGRAALEKINRDDPGYKTK